MAFGRIQIGGRKDVELGGADARRGLLYWKNDTQSMSRLNWVLDAGLTLQRPIGSIFCIKVSEEGKMSMHLVEQEIMVL
jgi:hypothetical protein